MRRLRMVDWNVFINATNDNPAGVTLLELPGEWPGWTPAERQAWVDEQLETYVPARRRVWELVELDDAGEVISSTHSMED